MTIPVEENLEERIDKYLQKEMDESRTTIAKLIDNEFILVNDKKTDINIVRDVLRHSNIQITNTYLTVDDDKKNNAINNIDMGGILNGQS